MEHTSGCLGLCQFDHWVVSLIGGNEAHCRETRKKNRVQSLQKNEMHSVSSPPVLLSVQSSKKS